MSNNNKSIIEIAESNNLFMVIDIFNYENYKIVAPHSQFIKKIVAVNDEDETMKLSQKDSDKTFYTFIPEMNDFLSTSSETKVARLSIFAKIVDFDYGDYEMDIDSSELLMIPTFNTLKTNGFHSIQNEGKSCNGSQKRSIFSMKFIFNSESESKIQKEHTFSWLPCHDSLNMDIEDSEECIIPFKEKIDNNGNDDTPMYENGALF